MFGRAAVQAYMDGYGGRLMRSMKSILGSPLVDQTTEVGEGYGVPYLDFITTYLRHVREHAQAASGQALTQVVLGRPVYFVDEDPERDAQAEASLRAAAQAVGFESIHFQFEPIAAAFDYEQQVQQEQRVLVADIGGGAFGPSVGGAEPRPVPSRVYFDLSTWHLINTVYQPARVAELKSMAGFYGNPVHHTRLMRVIHDRLGHNLISRAEQAKIDVATTGLATLDLGLVERGLNASLKHDEAAQALDADLQRIVDSARETVQRAAFLPTMPT